MVSIPEVLVNAYFLYLYFDFSNNNMRNLVLILIMSTLLLLYLINIISFLSINCIYLNDEEFSRWMMPISTKITYFVVLLMSLCLNHKIFNILFCKIFNFNVFKAKLTHVSKLFCLHFMWFISLVHTIAGITLAIYHLAINGANINNQLNL